MLLGRRALAGGRPAGTAIVLIFWLFFRRKLGAALDAICEAFARCDSADPPPCLARPGVVSRKK